MIVRNAHANDVVSVTVFVCMSRQRYKQFIRVGCQLGKTRYTGADNAKLGAAARAKRFVEYLQVCCNLHRGKDFKYIKDVFFPLFRLENEGTTENVSVFALYIDTYMRANKNR